MPLWIHPSKLIMSNNEIISMQRFCTIFSVLLIPHFISIDKNMWKRLNGANNCSRTAGWHGDMFLCINLDIKYINFVNFYSFSVYNHTRFQALICIVAKLWIAAIPTLNLQPYNTIYPVPSVNWKLSIGRKKNGSVNIWSRYWWSLSGSMAPVAV